MPFSGSDMEETDDTGSCVVPTSPIDGLGGDNPETDLPPDDPSWDRLVKEYEIPATVDNMGDLQKFVHSQDVGYTRFRRGNLGSVRYFCVRYLSRINGVDV